MNLSFFTCALDKIVLNLLSGHQGLIYLLDLKLPEEKLGCNFLATYKEIAWDTNEYYNTDTAADDNRKGMFST